MSREHGKTCLETWVRGAVSAMIFNRGETTMAEYASFYIIDVRMNSLTSWASKPLTVTLPVGSEHLLNVICH